MGTDVVVVRGEIDMSNAEILRQAVTAGLRDAEAASAAVLIVDLSAVTFMDSAGLTALVVACRTSAVQVRLVVASPAVQRIFDVSGMSCLPESYPTVDCAVAGAS